MCKIKGWLPTLNVIYSDPITQKKDLLPKMQLNGLGHIQTGYPLVLIFTL